MLLDEFWHGFWEYWHCGKFVLWACMNIFMMHVGNFVGMYKFISWTWQNCFVGMNMDKLVGIDKFCGYGLILMGMKFWLWRNLLGMWCLIMENIFVAMILDMWEFTCCTWTCRKFFVGYLGHVGILIEKKKFGSYVWTCEKFWLWWNFWWGIDFFGMEIILACDLSWNNEVNFHVAEP